MNNYDDEILFFEDFGESVDGTSIRTIRASFTDGTKITAHAEVSIPPSNELTPREVEYYDPMSGEILTESDEGQTEAWELEAKTTAYRLLDQIRALIVRIPEQPKMECPDCRGRMVCSTCAGAGCQVCKNNGACRVCDGRGWVFAV